VAQPSRTVKTAFLRRVYATATAASEAARNTYLDGLEATALTARASGKLLTASGFGTSSASYSMFVGWHPDVTLELCEWARDYISESTAALAVASVPPAVRYLSTSFSGVAR
jgi:hypothetical protein